jgi:hypothetical protein
MISTTYPPQKMIVNLNQVNNQNTVRPKKAIVKPVKKFKAEQEEEEIEEESMNSMLKGLVHNEEQGRNIPNLSHHSTYDDHLNHGT